MYKEQPSKKAQSPYWAYCNISLFRKLDELHKLYKVNELNQEKCLALFKKIETEFDPSFSPINLASVISALYMMLVVPQQIWETDKTKGTSFAFNTSKHFEFKIDKRTSRKKPWEFLRLMRNALAHANFEAEEDFKLTFWNIPLGSDEKDFEVSISLEDTSKFLDEIAEYYISDVLVKYLKRKQA